MSHVPKDPFEETDDISPRDPGGSESIPDDPRLVRAAREYLEELESGRRPDRRAWLERYPDLAEALGQCLDGLELVHRAAPLMSSASGDSRRTVAPASEPVGANPLGDFQILHEIGRGGMGIVYEAIQLSLVRRVALKVLPLAATFDAKHLQRFRQEAQAAAQLHHTNIVPVYAVGCERGIHYYAMQLIDGQSLDAVVRQLRRQAGLNSPEIHSADTSSFGPRRDASSVTSIDAGGAGASEGPIDASVIPLETTTDRSDATPAPLSNHFSASRTNGDLHRCRAIARCMAQAAEALEYAHQQGVVHRDIKPANLLIDARGSVWITDFGLAHFHDAPGLTQTGDILGTIRYMSPEQASGQRVVLDHRTDVYSLAATFYELLTLRPVFDGRTRHALLDDVLNRDPRPPRSIDRRIPDELETILLKALNKSPAERYASAQELADDLHRFLRDEPIRAKRPSRLEQARKWSRRHPSFVAAGVLVMFLSLVGSLVGNWLITKANDRTRAALAREQLRAEEAEESFQQAREAVDVLITGQEELGNEPHRQALRKRLLETALGYYQRFIAQRAGDPAAQTELLAVQNKLKKILDDLSVLEGAGQLILLSEPSVQDDLGLDDGQRKRIDDIAHQFGQKRSDLFRDFDQLSSSDRQSRHFELAREGDRAMRAAITETQRQRLGQITLQLQGLRAFDEPEVIERLRLTTVQREHIRQAGMAAFASMWNDPGKGRDHPRPEEFREGIMQPAVEKALAVLTPAQLAEWKKLIGPAFVGALDRPPPGSFPGLPHDRGLGPPRGERPPMEGPPDGWSAPVEL